MEDQYIIANQTAFQVWRAHRDDARGILFPSGAACSPAAPSGVAWRDSQAVLEEVGCVPPYHVIVGSQADRRRLARGKTHYVKRLPPETALWRLSSHLLVPSIELCLLQMAGELTFVQLMGASYESCGSYTPAEGASRNPRALPPLTSKEALARYAGSAAGMHGVKKMREAVEFVLDGSRSVKETQLALLLVLPGERDGLGFPEPLMNCKIPVPFELRGRLGQGEYTVDVFWPQWRLALEYDSSLHHRGSLERDAGRRNDLQYLGYTVVQATPNDMRSARAFARFAVKLSKHLDAETARRMEGFEVDEGFDRLFEEVMALSRFP